jgi:hypothetical protein
VSAPTHPPGRPLPPPGWYPDPSCAEVVRYWDGQAWSLDEVRRAAPPRPDAVGPDALSAWRAAPIQGLTSEPVADAVEPTRPIRSSRRRWGWVFAAALSLTLGGGAVVVLAAASRPSPAQEYQALADRYNASEAPTIRDLGLEANAGVTPGFRHDLQILAASFRSFDRDLADLHLPGQAGADASLVILNDDNIAHGFDEIAADPGCGCTVSAEIAPFESMRAQAVAKLRSDLGLPPPPNNASPIPSSATA